MKTRTAAFFFAALAAAPAAQADNVTYFDPAGETNATCETCTAYTGQTTLSDGWYVVEGAVASGGRITVGGDVNLILADGAELTAEGGIRLAQGNSLTVWAQRAGTGKLTANATSEFYAGIGGNGNGNGGDTAGTLTVNGGAVSARGSGHGAGVGGGNKSAGGTVVVNGGSLTASGRDGAAGIGGGDLGRHRRRERRHGHRHRQHPLVKRTSRPGHRRGPSVRHHQQARGPQDHGAGDDQRRHGRGHGGHAQRQRRRRAGHRPEPGGRGPGLRRDRLRRGEGHGRRRQGGRGASALHGPGEPHERLRERLREGRAVHGARGRQRPLPLVRRDVHGSRVLRRPGVERQRRGGVQRDLRDLHVRHVRHVHHLVRRVVCGQHQRRDRQPHRNLRHGAPHPLRRLHADGQEGHPSHRQRQKPDHLRPGQRQRRSDDQRCRERSRGHRRQR